MHLSRVLRPVALIVAIALVAIVLPSPGARATGASPRWTVGDFWESVDRDGDLTRVEVRAKEPTGAYDTFHFKETVASGSLSFTTDLWIREADFGRAKLSMTILSTLTVTTYDPPQIYAAFPLVYQKAWYGNTSFRITAGGSTVSSGTLPFSGYVEAETDVTVPAGRFHVFVIRSPVEPTIIGHTKYYYSDAVGYWVKEESYNLNGDLTGERSMTRHNYQSQIWFNVLLIVIIAVVAIAVIAFLMKRRKQSLGRPGGPQAPPQAPPQMPQGPPPGT